MPSKTTAVANRPKDFELVLTERSPELAVLLTGTDVTPERFIKATVHAIARSPELLTVDRASLLLAILEVAEMGLEPTGQFGGAHLVVFKGKVQAITDYRGLVKMALRSGQLGAVSADIVYERDEFAYSRGTAPAIHHNPALSAERGPATHAYAVAWAPDGRPLDFAVLTLAEIEVVRVLAPAGTSSKGPWVTHWPAMARKTAVRRLLNLIPVAITPQLAAALDREDRPAPVGPVSTVPESRTVLDARARLLGRIGVPEVDSVPEPPQRPAESVEALVPDEFAGDGLPAMAP